MKRLRTDDVVPECITVLVSSLSKCNEKANFVTFSDFRSLIVYSKYRWILRLLWSLDNLNGNSSLMTSLWFAIIGCFDLQRTKASRVNRRTVDGKHGSLETKNTVNAFEGIN